jgi:hypothetical protein
VFREVAAGDSVRLIAKRLNAEGSPLPNGALAGDLPLGISSTWS